MARLVGGISVNVGDVFFDPAVMDVLVLLRSATWI